MHKSYSFECVKKLDSDPAYLLELFRIQNLTLIYVARCDSEGMLDKKEVISDGGLDALAMIG